MNLTFAITKSHDEKCWYAKHEATGTIRDGDTPAQAIMMCAEAVFICLESSDYSKCNVRNDPPACNMMIKLDEVQAELLRDVISDALKAEPRIPYLAWHTLADVVQQIEDNTYEDDVND